MKRILVNLSKVMVMLAFVAAQVNANVACVYTMGQDELPEKVKNLRRF